jgi:O-antigen ligase
MTDARAVGAARDRLAIWCGWVLVAIAAAIPPFAWLAPKGLALLAALGGLLCLPAVRLTDEDRPSLITLFGLLIWASASTTWSLFHPKSAITNTVLKLAFELPLYWSLICAARRATPALQRRALHVLAWGMTVFGLILLVETLTGGALYQNVRDLFYHAHPMRPDIAQAKLGHATFVLTALLPIAFVGAPRRLRLWLGLVMAAGAGSAAIAFGSDAPVIALVAAPLAGLAVWRWPSGGPRIMAASAATLFLTTPAIVWAVRRFADYEAIQRAIPLSYAERMGYWSHAIDWIAQRPLRGWGIDASRMLAPGIKLHPHDGALQMWLELGVVGAVAAAAFWGVSLLRLAKPERDPAAAATAACAAVYLLFGALNFGLWQEWWLALGALIVALAALIQPTADVAQAEA